MCFFRFHTSTAIPATAHERPLFFPSSWPLDVSLQFIRTPSVICPRWDAPYAQSRGPSDQLHALHLSALGPHAAQLSARSSRPDVSRVYPQPGPRAADARVPLQPDGSGISTGRPRGSGCEAFPFSCSPSSSNRSVPHEPVHSCLCKRTLFKVETVRRSGLKWDAVHCIKQKVC